MIILSGCLEFLFIKNINQKIEDDGRGEEGNYSVKITSMRIPQKGERIEITDPNTQQRISVTLGEVFTAASGKICSDFTINEDDRNDERHGLACLNNNHEWDRNSLDIKIINK